MGGSNSDNTRMEKLTAAQQLKIDVHDKVIQEE
jgi:hypothetical protein